MVTFKPKIIEIENQNNKCIGTIDFLIENHQYNILLFVKTGKQGRGSFKKIYLEESFDSLKEAKIFVKTNFEKITKKYDLFELR